MTGPEFGVLVFLLLIAAVLSMIFLVDREKGDRRDDSGVDAYFTFQWFEDD